MNEKQSSFVAITILGVIAVWCIGYGIRIMGVTGLILITIGCFFVWLMQKGIKSPYFLKRLINLYWQLLLLPFLYYPYKFFRKNIIVNLFGRNLPDFAGEYKANIFTWFFWLFIAIIIITISMFYVKKLETWYYRLLYIIGIILSCGYISLLFISSMYFIAPPC